MLIAYINGSVQEHQNLLPRARAAPQIPSLRSHVYTVTILQWAPATARSYFDMKMLLLGGVAR